VLAAGANRMGSSSICYREHAQVLCRFAIACQGAIGRPEHRQKAALRLHGEHGFVPTSARDDQRTS
jgi:hypothetical protein